MTRKLQLIGCLAASLTLAACGSSTEASSQLHRVAGTASPPRVQVPPGPPPAKVVVRDLRKGRGVPLEEGDAFTVNYVAVEYGTGKQREAHWERGGGFSWQYGKGKVVKGWVPGLRGMRVGGRRELIVPSRLAYHSGPLVYVVELVEAK